MTTDPVPSLDDFLLDEFEEPEGPAREGYRIGGDREAAWAMRKLAAAAAEQDRIVALHAQQRDQLDAWRDAALAGPSHDAEFFEAVLVDYRRRLEQENPNLRRTYPVPGGKLAKRAAPASVEITDEDTFVEWAFEYHPDALRMKPLLSALKADPFFTKDPDPKGDDPWTSAIVDSEGEVVPGARMTRGAPRYSATPTTNPQENPDA